MGCHYIDYSSNFSIIRNKSKSHFKHELLCYSIHTHDGGRKIIRYKIVPQFVIPSSIVLTAREKGDWDIDEMCQRVRIKVLQRLS